MRWDQLKQALLNDDFFVDCLKNFISLFKKITIQNPKEITYFQLPVTKRIEQIRQPKGGYLKINLFEENKLVDNYEILEYESTIDKRKFPTLLGLVVDYVSRFLYTKDLIKSFEISFMGLIEFSANPRYASRNLTSDELLEIYDDYKNKLLSLNSLDLNNINSSENIEIIKNIFPIVQLDSFYRSKYEPENIWIKDKGKLKLVFSNNYPIPDYICKNALICIKRTIDFYNSKNNIVFGEVFDNGQIINSGDCDFISDDTIWDLKVSSKEVKDNSSVSRWTLQILIYYLMLKHKTHHNYDKYHSVKKIGIFNPYHNVSYELNVNDIINEWYIDEIKKEIIGLDWNLEDGFRCDSDKYLQQIEQIIKNEKLKIKIYSKYKEK